MPRTFTLRIGLVAVGAAGELCDENKLYEGIDAAQYAAVKAGLFEKAAQAGRSPLFGDEPNPPTDGTPTPVPCTAMLTILGVANGDNQIIDASGIPLGDLDTVELEALKGVIA